MAALDALRGTDDAGRARRLLLALLAFHVLIHVRYLNLPPVGFHLWRQTDTLVIARNFAEEGMNLFEPRSSYRMWHSGIVGMEFPIIPYLMAIGYRLFGERDVIPRVISLVLSTAAIAACYAFGRRILGSRRAGLGAATALTLSPLFVYYGITSLPDVPMLGALFAGLALLAAWSGLPEVPDGSTGDGSRARLAGGLGLLALAALLKLSAVVAAPVALGLLARGIGRHPRQRGAAVLAVLGAAGVVAGWYLYARELNRIHRVGIFSLAVSWPYPMSVVGPVAHRIFTQWLPELFVGYAACVWFIAGLAWLVTKGGPERRPPAAGERGSPGTPARLAALGLAAATLAYALAFLPMLEIHDYYMIASLPLLVTISGVGFERVARAAERRRGVAVLAGVVLALAAVIGPVRGLSRLEGKRPSGDLASVATTIDRVIPDRRARIIAASDPSPNIFLYFMHRTGWSASEAVTDAEFLDMAAHGARYLVSNSRALEERPAVARCLRPLASHGRFRVFEIDCREVSGR